MHRGPLPQGAPWRLCSGTRHIRLLWSLAGTMHACRHYSQPCMGASLHMQALRMPLPGDAKVVYSEAPRFWGLLRPREYVT